MRIISGKLKGKNISYLKNFNTRPLKDSVKENIFNVINHSNLLKVNIENAKVLDLYSGVGSFGLECYSRGAKNVTFVEKNYLAAETLKKNLKNLNIKQGATVIEDEISEYFKKKLAKKFEIIFLDPPFKSDSFLEDLEKIKEKKIHEKDHLVIIHREKNSLDNFNIFFKTILEKNYGRSKVIFGKILW